MEIEWTEYTSKGDLVIIGTHYMPDDGLLIESTKRMPVLKAEASWLDERGRMKTIIRRELREYLAEVRKDLDR